MSPYYSCLRIFPPRSGSGANEIVLATRARPSFANAIHVSNALSTISSDLAGGGTGPHHDRARQTNKSICSPDWAKRNPGRMFGSDAAPGFRCAQPRLRK